MVKEPVELFTYTLGKLQRKIVVRRYLYTCELRESGEYALLNRGNTVRKSWRMIMSRFGIDKLKQRSFERIAFVLKHFYEEQAEDFKAGNIALHSRIFDTLILDEYIYIGKSEAAAKLKVPYKEHVVPCAYIRNCAFRLYSEEKTVNDVAKMVSKLLKIALIAPDEASLLDKKYRSTMPLDWNWETDSTCRRLDDCGIKLILSD